MYIVYIFIFYKSYVEFKTLIRKIRTYINKYHILYLYTRPLISITRIKTQLIFVLFFYTYIIIQTRRLSKYTTRNRIRHPPEAASAAIDCTIIYIYIPLVNHLVYIYTRLSINFTIN